MTATTFAGPGAWRRALSHSLQRRLWQRLTDRRDGRADPQKRRSRAILVACLVLIAGMTTVGVGGGGLMMGMSQTEAEDEETADAAEAGVLSDELVPEVAQATEIPEDALYAYASASRAFEVNWTILAGIGKVECDHGRHPAEGCNPDLIDDATGEPQVNDVGARGPMQFLGGTWRAGASNTDPDVAGPPIPEEDEGRGYATDGDDDGTADPWNWFDATHSAARYLLALGLEDDPECAVFGYNQGGGATCDPSHEYPTKVMEHAGEYAGSAGIDEVTGHGSVAVAGGDCSSGHVTGGTTRSLQPQVTRATQAMVDAVVDCFGRGRYGLGCYRTSPAPGEHPRGRGCDFMASGGDDPPPPAVGVERARGDAMAAWLQANYEELNVLYVIWWGRIWNPSRDDPDLPHAQWRSYSGDSDHKNHVHVSVELMPGDPSWAHCTRSDCNE